MRISEYKQDRHPCKGTKSLDVGINTCPHYSDYRYRHEKTEFCSEPENLVKYHDTLIIPEINYDYSDRLYEWNAKKYKEACKLADEKFNTETRSTARYLQDFLRYYFDNSLIELVHIVAGVNRGNGYPYLIYGYRKPVDRN